MVHLEMDFSLAQTPPNRRKGKTDSFTDELGAKLKERRRKGLSADMTDDDDDDGLGASDDDIKDILSQYNKAPKKQPQVHPPVGQQPWRPPSFKKQGSENDRRNSAVMNEMGEGRKSPAVNGRKSPAMNDRKSPAINGRKSPYDLDTKGIDDRKRGSLSDTIFGQKSQKGVIPDDSDDDDDDDDDDELLSAYRSKSNRPWQPAAATSKKDSILGRTTPNKDRTTPTQEDIIFGRKTPTQDGHSSPSLFKGSRSSPSLRRQSPLDSLLEGKDEDLKTSLEKKPWQPPTFKKRDSSKSLTDRKSSLHPDEDEGLPMPQPRRKKDYDSGDSARSTEPKPKPRHRMSHDQSHDDLDGGHRKSPVARRKPSSDIFGERKSSHDNDEQLAKQGRRTPVGNKGRQSPAPPGGRKTPTGSRSGTPIAGTKEGKKTPTKELNKNSSLLDMLGGSKPTAVPRRKSLLAKSDESEEEGSADDRQRGRKGPHPQTRRRPSLLDGQNERHKSYNRLGGSSDEEDGRGRKEERYKGPGAPPVDRPRDRDSSLIRDVTTDPQKNEYERLEREKEKNKRQKNSQQRQSVKDLENMIDKVADAQLDDEDNTMKPIKPHKSERQSKSAAPHKPKARYATTPDPALDQPNSFDDTVSIRQSVYNEWYKERMKAAKKEKADREKKEKEKEEKKAKDEQDKKLEAMASFKAWQDEKKESDKIVLKKRREEEKKKREKEEEELQKKKDSLLVFRSWKENKDVKLKEDFNKTKREELNKAKEEEDMKKKKKKESEGSYTGWKRKKDKLIVKQAVEERREKKKTEKELMETQHQKEKEADDTYENWIERKEKQLKKEQKDRRQKKYEEYDNPRPAWSPSGKTVPFGR